MPLKLYDTMAREKRDFVPADPERVTMYVCGPTVYNFSHVGNFRPVVVFDVLFRLLRRLYGKSHVRYAANVTDVDDKIYAKAAEEGVPIGVITRRYLNAYIADSKALGALRPTYRPRATRTIREIKEMIARLIRNNAAYVARGHVLFDTQAFTDYGKLSGRPLDEMIAGARVEVAPYKRHPADFVLWKPSKPGEKGWRSDWGRGRPGWHIECSAMIEAKLGLPIDIHGGGIDLVFPHHENELAQGVCACGHAHGTYSHFWMHNGFLNMGDEKMSKSVGNVTLAHDLLKTWPGEAIRWALLSGHYRSPLEWSGELIESSKRSLDRLYQTLLDVEVMARQGQHAIPRPDKGQSTDLLGQLKFWEAVEDDLNLPRAMRELFALSNGIRGQLLLPPEVRDWQSIATQRHALLTAGRFLGFLEENPSSWFQRDVTADEARRIAALVEERATAREVRDWARADRIRDELQAQWVVVADSKETAAWRRETSPEAIESAARIALRHFGVVEPSRDQRVDFLIRFHSGTAFAEVKAAPTGFRGLFRKISEILRVNEIHKPPEDVFVVAVPNIWDRDYVVSQFESAARETGVSPGLLIFNGRGDVEYENLNSAWNR